MFDAVEVIRRLALDDVVGPGGQFAEDVVPTVVGRHRPLDRFARRRGPDDRDDDALDARFVQVEFAVHIFVEEHGPFDPGLGPVSEVDVVDRCRRGVVDDDLLRPPLVVDDVGPRGEPVESETAGRIGETFLTHGSAGPVRSDDGDRPVDQPAVADRFGAGGVGVQVNRPGD